MGRSFVMASSAISSACIAASAGRTAGVVRGLRALPVLRARGVAVAERSRVVEASSTGVPRVSSDVDLSGRFVGRESGERGDLSPCESSYRGLILAHC